MKTNKLELNAAEEESSFLHNVKHIHPISAGAVAAEDDKPFATPSPAEESAGIGLDDAACSRLRRTLCNVLLALGNGSACSQDASIEFIELIPTEVEAVRKKWERNHDRELANVRKAEAALADAAQLLAEIMRDAVNYQDEAEDKSAESNGPNGFTARIEIMFDI